MSKWQNMKLRQSQINYAAMDAFALVEIYEHLDLAHQQQQPRAQLEPVRESRKRKGVLIFSEDINDDGNIKNRVDDDDDLIFLT